MRVRANGVELHCRIDGAGDRTPWLVMCHGVASDAGMWDGQVAALADRFRILRFDLRGHGESELTPPPYTLDMLADDVHGLLLALGIRRVHWLGLSIGGIIGQVFALKYPQMPLSLVLADTASRIPPGDLSGWEERVRLVREQGMQGVLELNLGRWFTPEFRRRRPDAVERIARQVLATPVDGYVGCALAVPTIDVTHRLAGISCPSLVIVGERDPTSTVAMAREIHEALPGSRLVVIPDAAHLSNIENPEAFNRALLEFFDGLRPSDEH